MSGPDGVVEGTLSWRGDALILEPDEIATGGVGTDEIADGAVGTADIAGLVPAVQGWAGAWDALAEELNATWVTGKDQAQALADAEARMNEELD